MIYESQFASEYNVRQSELSGKRTPVAERTSKHPRPQLHTRQLRKCLAVFLLLPTFRSTNYCSNLANLLQIANLLHDSWFLTRRHQSPRTTIYQISKSSFYIRIIYIRSPTPLHQPLKTSLLPPNPPSPPLQPPSSPLQPYTQTSSQNTTDAPPDP